MAQYALARFSRLSSQTFDVSSRPLFHSKRSQQMPYCHVNAMSEKAYGTDLLQREVCLLCTSLRCSYVFVCARKSFVQAY